MLAVLEDSIICFQKYLHRRNGKEKRMYDDAAAWILENDGDWPFSFENVCFHLDIDPSYVRDGLMRWKRRALSELPPSKQRLAHKNIKSCGRRKEKQAAA